LAKNYPVTVEGERRVLTMSNKVFVSKRKFLEKIDELEIVEITQLANYLDMTYHATANRLHRYVKAGLVEPLGMVSGKYCLSNKGYIALDYLKKYEE
jgi:gamma-glutamylcyclotransferase (GGCT)/AIG2-like uncharacterized protein YtfP